MLQEKMRIILFVRYFQRAVELVLIIDHVFLIFDKSSRYQKPNIHLASIIKCNKLIINLQTD